MQLTYLVSLALPRIVQPPQKAAPCNPTIYWRCSFQREELTDLPLNYKAINLRKVLVGWVSPTQPDHSTGGLKIYDLRHARLLVDIHSPIQCISICCTILVPIR
jgi:hypothetical protein